MQTATNPQTGEKVQWDGSAWVPLGGQAAPQPQAGIPELVVQPQAKPVDPMDVRKDELAIRKSELDIAAAERSAAQGPSLNANDQKLAGKRASLNSLEQQINRVEQLYRGNLKEEAYGLLSSIGDFLPTEENKQFDTAAAGLAEQGLSAFRVPGVGAQSDTELRQFVQANRPNASDYDATIEEKLRQLRTRVDATRSEMGMPAARWFGAEAPPAAAADPGAAPPGVDQSTNLGNLSAPPQEQLTRTTNGYETVDNPELSGVRGEYMRRLQSGQGAGEIIPWMRSVGVTDPGLFRDALKQIKFRKANPNVPIENYDTNALDDMFVPISKTETIMNDAAGTAPGAFAMSAGQALSMNTLDDMAPNQERAQIGLDDAQREHPGASLAGSITGGVTSALAGEAGLARLGLGAGFGRAALADTAYGAGAGAGANSDNRIAGAASGSLAGLLGSAAGQGFTRAGGSLIGGPTDASVRAVADQGIPLTVGQAVGRSGRLGQMVKSVEDRMSGIPVVGDAINARRTEGIRAMNAKAFDKALEPIGESVGGQVGEEAVAAAKAKVSDAFSRALAGKSAQVDEAFLRQARPALERLASIRRDGLGMEIVEQVEEATKGMFDETGQVISGDGMQSLLESLRQIRQAYRTDPLSKKIGDGIKDIERSVEGIFERQAADVMPQYRAAKAAYRRLSILSDSVNAGKNTEGVFTPAQLGTADRNNTKNLEGKISAAAGRSPFQDFQRSAQNVLPNRVPDSGTAGRLIVPGALIAGGAGLDAATPTDGAGVGIATALTLLYTKRGQSFLTKRGPRFRAAGKAIRERGRLIGAGGATVAVQGTSPDR